MIPHNWTLLDSSQIRKVKFVQNKHDLRGDVYVEFNEGKVYRYKDVPAINVEKMVHSSSPGEYFHGHIRNIYEGERVTDKEDVDGGDSDKHSDRANSFDVV